MGGGKRKRACGDSWGGKFVIDCELVIYLSGRLTFFFIIIAQGP